MLGVARIVSIALIALLAVLLLSYAHALRINPMGVLRRAARVLAGRPCPVLRVKSMTELARFMNRDRREDEETVEVIIVDVKEVRKSREKVEEVDESL